MIKKLNLDKIRMDGRTQPRGAINIDEVERFMEAMSDGAKFPPVVVFDDGTDHWLADGFHRCTAALALEYETISSDIRKGSQREAQWFSFSVNAEHGYPRTQAEVARILRRIFEDEEWSKTPLREIARHVRVSDTTVQRHRDKLSATSLQIEKPPPRTVTRSGKTYEMDSAKIGAAAAKPTPVIDPEARVASRLSLLFSEIHESATISFSTYIAKSTWPEGELRDHAEFMAAWLRGEEKESADEAA